MKRLVAIILLIPIVLICSACQPTPEKENVISKNDGKLEKALEVEAQPLTGQFSAPDKVEGKFVSGDVTVFIDADVTVPDVREFPVWRVYPEELTQKELDKYLNYFIGDSKVYESDANARSKADVLQDIVKYQELIAGLKNKNSDIYKENRQHRTDEEIQEYIAVLEGENGLLGLQKEYNSAPETIERKQVPRKLTEPEENYMDYRYGVLRGYTEDYEKFVWITASFPPYESITHNITFNLDAAYAKAMGYYIPSLADNNRSGNAYSPLSDDESINGAKYSYKEAKEAAEKVLSDLDLDYTLCYAMRCDRHYNGEYIDYQFCFAPRIPDSVAHLECYKSKNGDYSMKWDSPYIIIQVSDKGAFAFVSVSSMRFDKCINKNVPLLTFDEVWETAQKNIAVASDVMYYECDNPKPKVEIRIDSIHLSYIKIPEKGKTDSGLCIPVWMFYGRQTDVYDVSNLPEDFQLAVDDEGRIEHTQTLIRPFFCINAIDGSIIDLTQGY